MHNITDEVVECIKVIAENNRCETCDCIDGERVRFQCGHSYCGDCLTKVEHCLLCLTPPDAALQTPCPDYPATKRAQHAATLLKTFEETFDVDVYKRSRISEQLKVEKEVFPDCIQAPVKYHNKRKSSIFQFYKENSDHTFFPGEQISCVKPIKMENSFNYVQNWLDNNVRKSPKISPRRPFNDLNVNSPNVLKRRIPGRTDVIFDKLTTETSKENLKSPSKKKRKVLGFKSSLAIVGSQSLLDRYLKPVNKQKKYTKIKNGFDESAETSATRVLNKTNKDESTMVIDDDPIVIDDSQSQVVDKDKLAWLAVIDANEKSPYVTQSLTPEDINVNSTDIVISTDNNQATSCTKVPFIKRSYLIEKCDLCRLSKSDLVTKKVAEQPKDVSITIESSRFVTTIKMSTVQDKPVFEKHSVPVQTDASDLIISGALDKQIIEEQPSAVVTQNVPLDSKDKEVPSQDMFTAEIYGIEDHKSFFFANQPPNENPQVIIEDSDSDDAVNESGTIQVEAQIHHSSEQLEPQVLAELDQSEIQQRAKRSGRGITPNSSDSSDKENFDPNKLKKKKLDKKDSKKRRVYQFKN